MRVLDHRVSLTLGCHVTLSGPKYYDHARYEGRDTYAFTNDKTRFKFRDNVF